MATIVRVQLTELDLSDAANLAALADLDNATFGRRDGISMMTVYIEDGQDVVATVIEATRKLSNKVPGVSALRVHPDLVAASNIAERVGVSREAVRKWTQDKRKPFPLHFGTVGKDMRVWRWVDVTAWLLDAKGIADGGSLPTVEEIAHIDSYIFKVPDHTTQTWLSVASQPPTFVEMVATRPTATVHPTLSRRGRGRAREFARVG